MLTYRYFIPSLVYSNDKKPAEYISTKFTGLVGHMFVLTPDTAELWNAVYGKAY